jgi:hypothetical protein
MFARTPALPSCSCPLRLSPSDQTVDPEAFLPASPVWDRDSTRRFARRTVRPAYGSSLSRVMRGAEDTAPATTCVSIPGHARWSVRYQASSNFSNGSCRSVASVPPRPVGSQPPFGLGISRSRRPYLPRYKTAFAFSDSPLPPPSSPFLAVGIPPWRDEWGLPCCPMWRRGWGGCVL